MNLSLLEKSLWLMLLTLLIIFGIYFGSVFPVESINVLPGQVVLFVALIVLLVVSQIVAHTVLAVAGRRRPAEGKHDFDERDRFIHLKANRNASYVLATGVFVSICLALVTEGNFLFTHVLLAFWVAAQLVEIGSQLVSYRKGI